MVRQFYTTLLPPVICWLSCASISVFAEDAPRPLEEVPDQVQIPLSFEADLGLDSKYVWRGQRLTDGWNLQPSTSLSVGNLTIQVWGVLDLEAVNEGDSLYLSGNPSIPPEQAHSGLQGHFSEVDFTFSYGLEAGPAEIDVGSIVYSFPDRGALLPTTAELYGSVEFPDLPLTPSAAFYVDVDETGKTGSTGLYCAVRAGHQVLLGLSRLPTLDIAATLGMVNNGFGSYYYGVRQSGLHDLNISLSLPIPVGERWSAGVFVNYSALLGDFRDHQYMSARSLYRGGHPGPGALADTVWGGVHIRLSF